MEGKGEVVYPDGEKYEGNFINDKINGYGILTFENGKKLEDYFIDGVNHVKGKYIWGDGRIYEGNINNRSFYEFCKLLYGENRVYYDG